jgi:hypothetical protein
VPGAETVALSIHHHQLQQPHDRLPVAVGAPHESPVRRAPAAPRTQPSVLFDATHPAADPAAEIRAQPRPPRGPPPSSVSFDAPQAPPREPRPHTLSSSARDAMRDGRSDLAQRDAAEDRARHFARDAARRQAVQLRVAKAHLDAEADAARKRELATLTRAMQMRVFEERVLQNAAVADARHQLAATQGSFVPARRLVLHSNPATTSNWAPAVPLEQ